MWGAFLHRPESPFLGTGPRWSRTTAERVKAAFYHPVQVNLDTFRDRWSEMFVFKSTLISCFTFVPDDGRRQRSAEAPAFHSCSAGGESETPDSSFPRLRRGGRRRADEARLDLWGFATPSPPPPPVPTPPSSPPAALISAQPARRPRGRPRSTPLPERASRRTASEAETPAHLKRQRCRSKKYQTGEYITDKVKLEDGERLEESNPLRQHSETPAGRQICVSCSSNLPALTDIRRVFSLRPADSALV